jgi:hypothetical protein
LLQKSLLRPREIILIGGVLYEYLLRGYVRATGRILNGRLNGM